MSRVILIGTLIMVYPDWGERFETKTLFFEGGLFPAERVLHGVPRTAATASCLPLRCTAFLLVGLRGGI